MCRRHAAVSQCVSCQKVSASMLLWTVITASLLWAIYYLITAPNPAPIFGKYNVRGPRFWLKYCLFRLLLWVRKVRRKFTDAEGGVLNALSDKDRPLPLSNHPMAFDSVYFFGSTKEGLILSLGAERRPKNTVVGPFFMRVPGLGFLRAPKMPDTVRFAEEELTWSAEGIVIEVVEPHKKWRIKYDGEMALEEEIRKMVHLKFDLIFESEIPEFNYDTDLHPHILASSIALQDWSRSFFKNLEAAHQTHYEQMGSMKGDILIEDITYKVDMLAFRDHSYGLSRDWDVFHRYSFSVILQSDGSMGVISTINYPPTCSSLQCGLFVTSSGEQHAIAWCDLELWQHGEGGVPPEDFAFRFEAGGKEYTAKMKVLNSSHHFVGWDWEARMVERLASCELNGVPGYALNAFQYHNASGRPPQKNDPDWFAEAVKQRDLRVHLGFINKTSDCILPRNKRNLLH